ncbi:MAG: hypothetical protein HUJ25_12275 [Crocinitomicaceae bacterium]|nr:hypothetical protein [Crocinitomicaceae bacterium]
MEMHTFSAGTVERIGNVMKIVYKKDSEITLSDMKEITVIREQLFGNEKYVTLIDLTDDNIDMSDEAKRYVTNNKKIKELRIAEVLLVKNFAHRLGVHTYVKIFRFNDKVTVMTKEENALHWLNNQYKKYFEKNKKDIPVEEY